MDSESGSIKSFMCRLCLRLYGNDELMEIFNSEYTDEQAIFDAVGVQPLQEDSTTSICVHCRHIISLINNFKTTCLQTDILLKNNSYALESDTWSILSRNDIFKQAADLIEIHRQDINAISLKDDFYDVEIDTANNSPQPERSPVNSIPAEYWPEEVLVSDHQIIKIESSDADVYHVSSDSLTPDNQTDDTKIKNESSDSFTSHTEAGDKILDLKQESDSSDSLISHHKSGNKILKPRKKKVKREINREKVICSMCGELVTRHGIEGHHNRHLGVKPFACDIDGCETKLYSKVALRQHRSRHKSGNRFYDCKECGKRIKGTASWLVHRKLHTDEPQISCDVCGKKFWRKYKLKIHYTVHTGIADFKCDICEKSFTVKHNLKAHYRIHMKYRTDAPEFEPVTLMKDES